MKAGRSFRTIAVLASAALVMTGMIAGTADAKKKKKPPAPVPAGCAAYTPSEWSADVPVTMLTDAHTAEAPLVVEVPTEMGVGTSDPATPDDVADDNPVSHVFLNVQVDSTSSTTGLYGTLAFSPQWDYDLYIRGNDGVGLAYSAGISPLVNEFGLDGTGHGGHTGMGSENVEGLETADCTGYLVDVVSSGTPGETVTLNLWLGEATYVPGS